MRDPVLALPLATELLERLPIPLCLRNQQSRYVWVNQAFEAAFGRASKHLLGLSDFDLLTHEQALLEQMRDERVFRTKQDVFFEERSGSANALKGTTGWHLAIRDSEGSVRYCLRQWGSLGPSSKEPVLRSAPEEQPEGSGDVQASLSPEDSLREERLMVLGQLAGPLAHQLGNPLCSMGLAIANVRRLVGTTACQDIRDALASAEESVAIADRIIKDLLAYSKIRPPILRPTAAAELVRMALVKFPLPPEIRLGEHLSEENVLVDGRQVSDAISNLITTTWEAMASGGILLITSRRSGDFVDLLIGDSRSPVHKSVEDRNFEPLVSTQDLGMGLGLNTARALIANQGGSLDYLAQALEDETVFRVRLRSGRQQVSSEKPADDVSPYPASDHDRPTS